jgi:hypothetical protein
VIQTHDHCVLHILRPAIGISYLPTLPAPELAAFRNDPTFKPTTSKNNRLLLLPKMAVATSADSPVKQQLVDKLPKRFKGIKFGIQ